MNSIIEYFYKYQPTNFDGKFVMHPRKIRTVLDMWPKRISYKMNRIPDLFSAIKNCTASSKRKLLARFEVPTFISN